jgi:MFS transporter, DHA2 family, methylenomycin A resistance protein
MAGIWLTLRHAPDTVRQVARRIDLAGQTLAVLTLAALTYAVIESGRAGWTSITVMACIAVAVASGALLIVVEARHTHPLLPLTLFRNAALNVSSITGLSLNFGYYGLMFAMSLFFQSARHDTPLQTGVAFLPMTAVVTVANLVSGRLIARFGYRLPMVLGQALAALGYVSLAFIHADSSTLAVALPLLAVGTGVALAVPSINAAVLMHVEPSSIGIASGVLNTARQIGGVVGVGVFGSLVQAESHDLAEGLHVAVILALVMTLFSLMTIGLGLGRSGTSVTTCSG